MALKKIVSGGQTGVDRAALDAALAAGFPCGGWVPSDRMAEDGVIAERYPVVALLIATVKGQRTEVREGEVHAPNAGTLKYWPGRSEGTMPERSGQSRASDSPVPGEHKDVRTARPVEGNYRQRTRQNVVDSDGTCILYYEALKGGSRLTRNLCALERKPYILLNAREATDPIVAAERILTFIEESGIQVLNVAGPRKSGWPEGYRFAFDVISGVITGALARRLRQVVATDGSPEGESGSRT